MSSVFARSLRRTQCVWINKYWCQLFDLIEGVNFFKSVVIYNVSDTNSCGTTESCAHAEICCGAVYNGTAINCSEKVDNLADIKRFMRFMYTCTHTYDNVNYTVRQFQKSRIGFWAEEFFAED